MLKPGWGVGGLLNGQSVDLHYVSMPHDRKTTEQIAIGMTVSLIRLTLVLPALLGGASAIELQELERIALFWGLSYQIVDDLKDVMQRSSESGKTSTRDLSLGRPNLALVLGMVAAAERLQRLIVLGDKILSRLLQSRPGLRFLDELRSELGEEALQMTKTVCAPVASGVA